MGNCNTIETQMFLANDFSYCIWSKANNNSVHYIKKPYGKGTSKSTRKRTQIVLQNIETTS